MSTRPPIKPDVVRAFVGPVAEQARSIPSSVARGCGSVIGATEDRFAPWSNGIPHRLRSTGSATPLATEEPNMGGPLGPLPSIQALLGGLRCSYLQYRRPGIVAGCMRRAWRSSTRSNYSSQSSCSIGSLVLDSHFPVRHLKCLLGAERLECSQHAAVALRYCLARAAVEIFAVLPNRSMRS